MTEQLKIINNFISREDAEYITNYFRKTVTNNEYSVNTFPSKVGFKNSKEASMLSEENPLQFVNGFSDKDLSMKVTRLVLEIKNNLEDFFQQKLDLVQFAYHVMAPGAQNGLHSDSTTLDGKPNRPDGIPEEQEYSALLYFNDYGVDYLGGELVFPEQDLTIKPKCGDLIIFKGDHFYPHSVNLVEMGLRDTLVLFFGKKGNVSDRTITSIVD